METDKTLSAPAPGQAPESPGAPGAPAPGTDNPSPSNLVGLASTIAAQHGAGAGAPEVGTTSKRRGRPPTHGLYSKAAGSDGKTRVKVDLAPDPGTGALQTDADPATVAPSVAIPPDMLSKIVQEGLSFAEIFATRQIESVAIKAGLTREETAPQLDQMKIGERRKALVGELAPLVCQEWGLDPNVSPTAAVALVLGPWAAGAAGAFFALVKIAEEKARADKP